MLSYKPWVFGLVLLALGIWALSPLFSGGEGNRIEALLTNQVHKVQVTAQVRVDLLAVLDAGKNALLAETSEASREYADKARASAAQVDQGFAQLQAISEKDGYDQQRKALDEAMKAWRGVKDIDGEYLALVVQKTNDQASRLSMGEAMDALEKLESSLQAAMEHGAGAGAPQRFDEACLIVLGQTAIILALETPHIAQSSDAAMDRIEARMVKASDKAKDALKDASGMAPPQAAQDIRQAAAAFAAFQSVNARILALSRINSDVKALPLAMERRQAAASVCEAALDTLQELIDKRLSQATR